MSRSVSLADSSDASLLELSREGTEDAFGELWRRHWGAGHTVARSVTSSFDPDDLVQEAFTRVYSAVRTGGGPSGAFRPYLFTTIRNTAASWGGKRRETSIDTLETFEDPATSEQATDAALDRGLTTRAFRSLPTRWQEVLWYSEVEQMAPAAIAPLLGMKANGVAALAYRAREGLRQAWIQAHIASAALGSPCRWSLERMGAYARGGLGTRDTRRMETHLDECARCTIVAAEAHDVGSRLALVLLPLVAGTAGATGYLAWLQSGANAVSVVAMPAAVTSGAGHVGAGIVTMGVGGTGTGGAGGTTGSAGTGGAAGAAGGASTGTIAGFTIGGVVLAGVIAASVAAAVTLSPGPGDTSAGASSSQSSQAPSAPAPSDEHSDRSAPSDSSSAPDSSDHADNSDDDDHSDDADNSDRHDSPSPSDPTPPAPRSDTRSDDPPPAEGPPKDETAPDESAPPASDDADDSDDAQNDADDEAPAAPTISDVDTGDAGVLYPLITGTAEPGSTVTLRITPSDGGDPVVVDDIAAKDDGSWERTVTDDDGLEPSDADSDTDSGSDTDTDTAVAGTTADTHATTATASTASVSDAAADNAENTDSADAATPYEVTATAERDGETSDPTDAASFDLAPVPSVSVSEGQSEGNWCVSAKDCELTIAAMPNTSVVVTVSKILGQWSDGDSCEPKVSNDDSRFICTTNGKGTATIAFTRSWVTGVDVAYDVSEENAERVVGGTTDGG